MTRYLKRGMDAAAVKAADTKVRETVEQILAQVDDRKDAAIRELSEKFDKWSPKDFKLSPAEIERAIGQVRKRDLDAARRGARPPPHSGELDRLLRAGRPLPDGRLRAHVNCHRQGGGC